MNDPLGSKTYSVILALRGSVSKKKCKEITEKIIDRIGMNKAHKGKMFNYPYAGKGNGYIYIQPIIESYISWDVWIKPSGCYVTICSCRDFDEKVIIQIFSEENLNILNMNTNIMSLL